MDNERYLNGWPGIGLAGAQWLVEQRVVAIGSDTMALEVEPGRYLVAESCSLLTQIRSVKNSGG